MTEQQIKQELRKHADAYATPDLDDSIRTDLYEAYREGYIAGATENGIKWHDLREDPNDLPKKNKSYWVYIDCQGNKIYRSIVWQGCWLGWNCIPLAWCEEPQFKE